MFLRGVFGFWDVYDIHDDKYTSDIGMTFFHGREFMGERYIARLIQLRLIILDFFILSGTWSCNSYD